MCNNSGIVSIVFCNKTVIEGLIWDQCGDTNDPNYTYGIGISESSNITIQSSTFQFSSVCTVVAIFIVSGYIEIQNSNFLYNHVIHSSRCQLYSSLLLVADDDFDGSTYTFHIVDTTFYHNGLFNSIKSRGKNFDSALYLQSSEKCYVIINIENSTISTSGGLGAFFIYPDIRRLEIELNGVTIANNSRGGFILRHTGSFLGLKISSSTLAYNSNGSLKVISSGSDSVVVLDKVSIHHNRGTFHDQLLFGNDGADEGVGLFLLVHAIASFIEISSCNIYNNIGGIHSIVYVKVPKTVFQHWASIISSNFTNNSGPALHILMPSVSLEGSIVYQGNLAERGAAVYIEDNTQIAIGEGSTIFFINNSVSLNGGAIYVDLPLTCSQHGVVRCLPVYQITLMLCLLTILLESLVTRCTSVYQNHVMLLEITMIAAPSLTYHTSSTILVLVELK